MRVPRADDPDALGTLPGMQVHPFVRPSVNELLLVLEVRLHLWAIAAEQLAGGGAVVYMGSAVTLRC